MGDRFERLLAEVAPSFALRRAQARLALEHVRAYEAASVGRRAGAWPASGGTANAEIGAGLARVRNRARQMIRDNEYAGAAIDALVSNAVGTGITVRPVDPDDAALWDRWFGTRACDADSVLNGAGLVRLAANHLFADGEGLMRRRWRLPVDGLPVPMQLQLLEPDHIDDSRTGIVNGELVLLGVVFDRIGRRAGYYLFPEHPGELATAIAGRARESVRVPATDVLHVFDKTRASQVRGVSRLARSLMRLRNLADYEDAELVRKKIEACFVAFVTTDSDTTTLSPELKAADDKSRANGEKVAPGLVKYLRPGETVNFGEPAPSAGGGEFTRRQLHAIAIGAGVTYAQLTGDMSQANFASNRMGLIHFRQLIDAVQWLVLVPQLIEPVRAWFREAALLSGAAIGGTGAHRITMPRRAQVDPLKDELASKEATRGGSMSLSEQIRERGDDPEAVFAEIARERAQLAALGIVVDSDAKVATLRLDPATVATAGDAGQQ